MQSLAVGIAIIPKLDQRFYEANRALYNLNKELLFQEHQIPHITLLQGFIKKSFLLEASKKLDNVFTKLPVTRSFIARKIITKNGYAMLEVGDDEKVLFNSQQIIKEALYQLLIDTAPTTDGFSDTVSGNEMESVVNYINRDTGNQFSPHITIGKGELPKNVLQGVRIYPDQVVLGQLGRHCTLSKEVIWQRSWNSEPATPNGVNLKSRLA